MAPDMPMGSTNMPDLRTRLTLDISDFTTGLAHARGEASLFGREIGGVTNHFRAAGVAMATFATVSLFTAGIIATAFMSSIAVLMTLGVVSAFQAESVQAAWSKTGEHLRKGMFEAARAYVPVLERLAERTRNVFDQVQPAIRQVFDTLAPVFEDLSNNFMDWFADLILRMPQMVNNALAFLYDIAPAWDAFTDNMRVGWDRLYGSIIEFGPTILKEGLPPFGQFIGNLLSMLGTVVEAASDLAGPFFTALAVVSDALRVGFADVVADITPELALFGATIENIGLGLVALLDGIGPQLSALIAELNHLGPFVESMFTRLGPVLEGMLDVVARVNTALMPVWESLATFIPNIGRVLVAVGRMIAEMARGFVEGIAPLIDLMGADNWADGMIQGIEAITPMMRELSRLFGGFVVVVIQGAGVIVNAMASIVSGFEWLTDRFGEIGQNAGRALVVGIIAGLGFMVSPLVGVVSGLVAAVAAFLPNSPAKTGPLSQAEGSPEDRGRTLGEMFADGIAASSGVVRAAAESLAGSAVLPGLPTSPGAPGSVPQPAVVGGGSVQNVTVNVAGSVLTERELVSLVQEAALRREARNAGSTFATSVRA